MARLRKLSDRFTETRSEGEIVIMRLDSGDFLSLTGTAAMAWSLIDGTRDRNAMVATLANEFSIPQDQISAEVDDFLHELRRSGLIADG